MTAREDIRATAKRAGWFFTPGLNRDTFEREQTKVDVYYTPLDAVASGVRTANGDNESTDRLGKKDTILAWLLLEGPSLSPEARGAAKAAMLAEFERSRDPGATTT